jgi:diguanylate cyclase
VPQSGAAVVRVGEFGPFDVLSDWAHRLYVDGFSEAAVRACREALLVVEPAGDRQTTRYLRYVEGVALLETGQHRKAITSAMDLVAEIDGEVDPCWRAKGLALLAEASAGAGELNRAMDALAEGAWLVSRADRGTYLYLSASMAVAIALRSVYLFEQAAELLVLPQPCADPAVALHVVQETAVLHAYWAATLELIGNRPEALPQLVRCAESALRMRLLAQWLGNVEMTARAEVLEAFATMRLGERGLASARARAAGDAFGHRSELLESQLLHLVIGGDLLARKEYEEARSHLLVAFTDAERTGRDVWSGTAMYALADADVGELGRHPAVGMWKRLAREALQRMWREREGRFAALKDRNRLRELSEESRRVGQESRADPLTGLGNRRMMADSVHRAGSQLSAVFVDVDRFKDVNDRFSHAVGDEVLLRVAEILRQHCRPEDDVIRYGGDEFVVLVFGEEGAAAAVEIAHRLHGAVRSTDWEAISAGLEVTVSVGVARASAADRALAAADAALYAAKRAGRDRVVAA